MGPCQTFVVDWLGLCRVVLYERLFEHMELSEDGLGVLRIEKMKVSIVTLL